ncbi:hypothetical protein HY496_02130 [Candidatus Woesearchaeota archaeon]|nr:hypothetical protein [Candidatus Woesearchaeota archaeon]
MGWIGKLRSERLPEEQSFSAQEALSIIFSSFQTWFEQEQFSPENVSQITKLSQQISRLNTFLAQCQQRFVDYSQRLQRVQEAVQLKELEFSQFQLDPHYQHLLELKKRRDHVQEKLRHHRDTLDSVFLILRQTVERPENAVFSTSLLAHYFFDPIKTLVEDKELRIVLQLKAIQAALDSHQLTVSLRDWEKVYAALQEIGPSAITAIQQDCLALRQELASVSQEVIRRDLLQKVDDADYWLQHHRQQAEKLEKALADLEVERRDTEEQQQELIEQLEMLVSSALQRKVSITL